MEQGGLGLKAKIRRLPAAAFASPSFSHSFNADDKPLTTPVNREHAENDPSKHPRVSRGRRSSRAGRRRSMPEATRRKAGGDKGG